MNKPHEHKELILKWADGAEIEAYDAGSSKWVPATTPTWQAGVKYRVKAAAPVVETNYSAEELYRISTDGNLRTGLAMKKVANAAIAKALADGQVETVEQGIEARKQLAAARALLEEASKRQHTDSWEAALGQNTLDDRIRAFLKGDA